MDDHLDMHFMQNSRNDQVGGRGHSRSWFVGFEVSSINTRLVNLNLTFSLELDARM